MLWIWSKNNNFSNCCSIALSNFEEYVTFATKFSQLSLLDRFFSKLQWTCTKIFISWAFLITLVPLLALLKQNKQTVIFSRLDSATKHVCKLANWLMEGKGELLKVLEIACELSAHAEKRSLRPELHKELSYHYNRSISFIHPRAHLWAPCDTAPPWAWKMGRFFVLPLALPQIALASALVWNKETHLLVILPSLPFFSTACFFWFLLYALFCHPRRRLFWKGGGKERCNRNWIPLS